MRVITTGNKAFEVEYSKLIIFDDTEVHGLPVTSESDDDIVKVLDWFNVNQGTRHDFDYISTGEGFIEEIFSPSTIRI